MVDVHVSLDFGGVNKMSFMTINIEPNATEIEFLKEIFDFHTETESELPIQKLTNLVSLECEKSDLFYPIYLSKRNNRYYFDKNKDDRQLLDAYLSGRAY